MSLPEKYDHPLYKHVKDEKDADDGRHEPGCDENGTMWD